MPCVTLYINNNVNVTHFAGQGRDPGFPRIGTERAVYTRASRDPYGGGSHSIMEDQYMEQTVFIICMFLGVASVALIAFTLLGIVLGRIKV